MILFIFSTIKTKQRVDPLLESRRVVYTTDLHWLSTFDLAGSFKNALLRHTWC